MMLMVMRDLYHILMDTLIYTGTSRAAMRGDRGGAKKDSPSGCRLTVTMPGCLCAGAGAKLCVFRGSTARHGTVTHSVID